MPPKPPLPSLTLPDHAAFSKWIATNSSTSPGIWLTLARKNQTHPTSLTMDQALEEALCHGWINGQAQKDSKGNLTQRFTPRTKTSTWSLRNVKIFDRLAQQGRVMDGGRAEVERAKGDGRWERAYGGSGAIEEAPRDLADAVEKAGLGSQWEALSKGERYKIYMALVGIKTDKGRERRIQGFVEHLNGSRDEHGEKSVSGRSKKSPRVVGEGGGQSDRMTCTRSGRVVKRPAS